MKKSDLYREWARVLDMCEGTNVDPGYCWRINGQSKSFPATPQFTNNLKYYSFAVAILEDKPVFVGDVIYAKTPKEIKYDVVEKWAVADGYIAYPHGEIDDIKFSWKPPKKTFTLNGEELPCPVHRFAGRYPITINGESVWFLAEEDRNKVDDAIIKLLKDATK